MILSEKINKILHIFFLNTKLYKEFSTIKLKEKNYVKDENSMNPSIYLPEPQDPCRWPASHTDSRLVTCEGDLLSVADQHHQTARLCKQIIDTKNEI